MSLDNIKLGILLPCTWSHVHVQLLDSMLAMKQPPNTIFLRSGGYRLDEIRNNLVLAALNRKCTHILFIDSDHYFEPNTIYKLLSHNLDVVGALCYERVPPYDPVMLKGIINGYSRIKNFKKGDLVKVDATGCGCLLVNCNVFKKIQLPYFHFMDNPDPNIKFKIGEDVYFCNLLKTFGYDIFVDTSVYTKHIGQIEVDHNTREQWADKYDE